MGTSGIRSTKYLLRMRIEENRFFLEEERALGGGKERKCS